MMCAVRRLSVALAGLVSLAAVVAAGVPAGGAVAAGGSAVAVRTVVGPGVLDTPGGLALSAGGDLFVADTGHCRVLVVPATSGTRVRPAPAGGTCRHPGRGVVRGRRLHRPPERRGRRRPG